MLDRLKQELINNDDEYIILKNGNIIEKSSNTLSLDFSFDCSVKVIHLIDSDTLLKYKIRGNKNVGIIEIFYSVEKSAKIDIELEIEENGKCDFLSIRKPKKISEIKANVNSSLLDGAYLNYKSLSMFESNLVLDENFYLEAENTRLDIKNVLINSANKSQEFNINIYHNAKTTISNLMNYAICRNSSFLKVNSKGIIKQGSHGAEIKQRTKGLLLDQNSELSANPLLEIDDFDVVANHGASIGAIDEDELYYLMSRGLSKIEAEKLIVKGFISPVIEEVREGKLKDYVLSLVNLNI